MVISWDHPEAIKLRRQIDETMLEALMEENIYRFGPNEEFYIIKGEPATGIALEALEKAAGEFLGGESHTPTSDILKRTSEACRAIERDMEKDEEFMKNIPRYS